MTNHPPARRCIALGTLMILAAGAGCATTPAPSVPSSGSTSARSSGDGGSSVQVVADSALEPDRSTIDGRTLYSMDPGDADWLIVEGDDAPARQRRTTKATTEHGAQVAVSLGAQRTQYWTESAGGVAMCATHAHSDRAISLFDPPLLIGPAELLLGVAQEVTVRMTIVDESDASLVRQRGTAMRRIEWRDDVEVDTPAGPRQAHRIETLFRAELDLARAEERATLLLIPGVGIVREDRVEKVRVLGLFTRTTRQTFERDGLGVQLGNSALE